MEDAVDLVLYAFDKGESGEILVKKSPDHCTFFAYHLAFSHPYIY